MADSLRIVRRQVVALLMIMTSSPFSNGRLSPHSTSPGGSTTYDLSLLVMADSLRIVRRQVVALLMIFPF